ncbi:hypothetical protein Aperf_G00000022738 [Anoplocephala perfoliata]
MANSQLASTPAKNDTTVPQAHLQQLQLFSPLPFPQSSLFPIPSSFPELLETPISYVQASESVSSQLPSSFQLQEGERKPKGGEEETTEGSTDRKRYRTTYTPYQSKVLEEVFQSERYISRPQRSQLAHRLHLPENTIKVWFQNRRMKEKRQAMMLPSIAGKSPYVRETLKHIANNLCNAHTNDNQVVERALSLVLTSLKESSVKCEEMAHSASCTPSPLPPSAASTSVTALNFSVDSLCPSGEKIQPRQDFSHH